ncbi:Cys-tRNA(Pro) deacylase [Alteromonas sp. 5E99-2]|uniref:Cys-tRNA(Pro) deacylase n=1 Tax=Alteromonas sp. 5E99-2 TaxID=2817683 RepID=UPI001A989F65|nr:Cys-tRNA(Pro) deacylase [Alteromonas sp. 5E99-2]MBO1254574.1 Cys-tRNA(Pro) deacylase [Alteromonas sp. 5E99-2]
MTPAVSILNKNNIRYQLHEYDHDTTSDSYGKEASEKMNVAAEAIFKTLVVKLNNSELVVNVIPVTSQLSMKAVAKAHNAKKATMADKVEVQGSTGYVVGGISPIGLKKALRVLIDDSALSHSSIFISGGRRGLEIELSPLDLKQIVKGEFTNLTQKIA